MSNTIYLVECKREGRNGNEVGFYCLKKNGEKTPISLIGKTDFSGTTLDFQTAKTIWDTLFARQKFNPTQSCIFKEDMNRYSLLKKNNQQTTGWEFQKSEFTDTNASVYFKIVINNS